MSLGTPVQSTHYQGSGSFPISDNRLVISLFLPHICVVNFTRKTRLILDIIHDPGFRLTWTNQFAIIDNFLKNEEIRKCQCATTSTCYWPQGFWFNYVLVNGKMAIILHLLSQVVNSSTPTHTTFKIHQSISLSCNGFDMVWQKKNCSKFGIWHPQKMESRSYTWCGICKMDCDPALWGHGYACQSRYQWFGLQ